MSKIVQKVHMLILMQPDISAAIDFYKQLGVKPVFRVKDTWAEMDIAGIKLGLCPRADIPDYQCRTGIVLEVDDLRAVYERLKDTQMFLSEPKEAAHGIMVSFKDPGNNILDLYQPTPEKVAELVKKVVDQGEDAACSGKQSSGCCKANGSCR